MLGSIFKFITSAVNGVVDSVMKSVNAIQETVTSPLRGFVGQVTNGIWKGDGANRFVAEMNSEVIPALTNIANVNIGGFANAIKKAMDLMFSAEKQAVSKANELFDVFGKIYK